MATEHELQRLVVRLMGDSSSYEKMMNGVEKSANKMADSVEAKTMRIKAFKESLRGFAGQMLGTITGLAGGLGVLNTITQGVSLAADAERTESAFKVMLGSAEKAKAMMADLQKFAAETPLEMGDLTGFTQMLLQSKVPADKMVETLRMLGDVAMGDRNKLQRLAYAYKQVKDTTVLQGDERNQLSEAGFDPLAEMARTSGKDITYFTQQMHKGLITFEMVQKAFKSASSEGGTFFNGMKEASTTLSGLFSTMKDDLAGFQREVGKEVIQALRLKEVLQAISAAVQWLTDKFKQLPQGMKTAIIAGGVLLTLIGTLGILWPAVAAAWTMAWGAVSAAIAAVASVGWPIIALVVAIGAVVAALVQNAGGVEAVWANMVSGAQQFWEFIKPVRQAVESLFHTIMTLGTQAWAWFVETVRWATEQATIWITETFGSMLAESGITLDSVRDGFRDAFLFAEFALKNFGLVWEVAWAGLKYFAVMALNAILKNIFLILAAPVLLPVFLALQGNWENLWANMTSAAVQALMFILQTAAQFPVQFANAMTKGWEGVKGFVAQVTGAAANVFGNMKLTWKGVEIPALDALEEQLRQEFDAKKGVLNQSWEEFKKEKLAEFEKENPGALDPAKKGEDDAKAYAGGLVKGIKGTEAVLVGSAEALSRRLEYIELMRERRTAGAKGGEGGGVQGQKFDNVRAFEKQNDLLQDIKKNTAAAVNKDTIPMSPANL